MFGSRHFSFQLLVGFVVSACLLAGCGPAQPSAGLPTKPTRQADAEKTAASSTPAQAKPNVTQEQQEDSKKQGKPTAPQPPASAAASSPVQEKQQPAETPPSQQPSAEKPTETAPEADAPGFLPDEPEERKFPFTIEPSWKRLSEKEEIWIDNQQKMVIVSGRICLTRGLLEMFACPKGTKEHESVVATYPWAMYVHQALLLIGANPGHTVIWEPDYKPAVGPKVQVECWYYNEKNELVKQNAKEMVKLVSDGSPLKIDWVFGGSKFVTDPDGRELYAANGGEMICLSNFSSAMIDLPIPSTAEAGGLLFEANPDEIPPLNTPVLLVLKPEIQPADKPATEKSAEEGSGGK